MDSPVGIVFLATRHAGAVELSAEASEWGWFRRLPHAMHPEQMRFLEDAGLAEPRSEGAESARSTSRRTDHGQ